MQAKRKRALFLAVLFAFITLSLHLSLLAEVDHDCSGEDCPVCEVVSVVSGAVKGACLIAGVSALFAAIFSGAIKTPYRERENLSASSLITLKVKLSN